MKTDNTIVNVAAAILGRTNMGQAMPKAHEIKFLVGQKNVQLSTAVYSVCEYFMECEEHENIFMEEGEGWVAELKKMGIAEAAKVWPDVFLLIAEASGEDLSQLDEIAA